MKENMKTMSWLNHPKKYGSKKEYITTTAASFGSVSPTVATENDTAQMQIVTEASTPQIWIHPSNDHDPYECRLKVSTRAKLRSIK